MDAIVAALLAGMDVQIQVLKVQSASIRQRLESLDRPVKTAVESYPERCADVMAGKCALQNDDARIDVGSFTDPNKWRCNACGWEELTHG